MRSGSSLLKALIATRKDVTHFTEALNISHTKPIILIKKRAYLGEFNYPQLPNINSKKIILIRNPYDTVISLQKMNLIEHPKKAKKLNDELVMLSYWAMVYKDIREKVMIENPDVYLVKYEELVSNCLKTTESIFKFIGCENTKGTNHYHKPQNYNWA
jgi:hypothetical protein